MFFARRFFLLIAAVLLTSNILSQESVFYSENSNLAYKVKKFGIEVYNQNFIKNNEYFNFIADGYTLLGTQIHPELVYKLDEKSVFKLGVYTSKNFGSNKIAEAIPTFSYNYRNGNHSFTIGNWSATNNHNLIEPLMASEKILGKELIETGFRYKYANQFLSVDAWLNWENYIVKYDDNQEVFTTGISSIFSALKKEKHTITIPISLLHYHQGGQINDKFFEDETIDSTTDLLNANVGFVYKNNIGENQFFRLGYHYLLHFSDEGYYPFYAKSGSANYVIGTYGINNLEFSLAYFSANDFISFKSNDMFKTHSVKIENNYVNGDLDIRYINHFEPNRELLFAKINYSKELSKNVIAGVQFEGFYQMNEANISSLFGFEDNISNHFDYSYGIYIRFNDVFNF